MGALAIGFLALAAGVFYFAWCVSMARAAEDPQLAPWSRGSWRRLGLRSDAADSGALRATLAVITEARDEDFFADFEAFTEIQLESVEAADTPGAASIPGGGAQVDAPSC
jgi:hypothetical protein